MAFKDDLYSKLTATTGITDIVETRIYYGIAPTNADVPYLTYMRISDDQIHHTGAASAFTRCQYQFSCWAFKELTSDNIANAVRNALDGFNGTLGSTRTRIQMTDQVDLYDSPDDGSQAGLWHIAVTFDIWHQRAVPTL